MHVERSLLLASVFAALATSAYGQTLVYDNTLNDSGYYYPNGSATAISGNTITALIGDDITPAAGFGGQTISSIGFGVVNGNTVAVSVRPLLRMWNADGSGGGPGTLINGWSFQTVSVNADAFQAFTLAPTGVTLPTGTFWLGMTFDDNNGTTGITADQLNKLGLALFSPPTIGTSQDVFFATGAAGSFLVNNPAGGLYYFGGNPAANFFFSIQAVPEPTALAFAGLAGLMTIALRRPRK